MISPTISLHEKILAKLGRNNIKQAFNILHEIYITQETRVFIEREDDDTTQLLQIFPYFAVDPLRKLITDNRFPL